MFDWLFENDRVSRRLALGLLAVTAGITLYSVTNRSSTASKHDKIAPNGRAIKQLAYLPSKIPLIGNTLELVRNMDRFLDWMEDTLVPLDGEPVLLRVMGQNDHAIFTKPEHYEEILKTQADNFDKEGNAKEAFLDMVKEAIIFLDGDRWKFHRRVFVRLFSTRALREYMAPIIQRQTLVMQKVLTQAASSKTPIDAHKLMLRLTLDSFTEIGFGYKLGCMTSKDELPFEKAIGEALHISSDRVKMPSSVWKLKRFLNVGDERRLREAVRVIDEFTLGIISDAIERRRQRSEAEANGKTVQAVRKDIVSIILDGMVTDGESVDSAVVRDISVAALIAGGGTTGDASSWLLHVLSHHPDVEQKLRAELLSKLPKLGIDMQFVPSVQDLQDLTYLEATIYELMRLFPPGPVVPTHCQHDTILSDGTFLAAGTDVSLAVYATGRLPSVWGPDAALFKPERFIDPETGALISFSSTKLPVFSAGPRACPGQQLAIMQLKTVLSCLLSRFHLQELPGQEVTSLHGVGIGMKNPLLMRVEPVAQPFGADATSSAPVA